MKKHLQKLDILGLFLLVAGLIWGWVSAVWGKWVLILLIAGGILLIVGIVSNYKQILASLGKRSGKYAGNYVISLILVIFIVSFLNYIGVKHVKRFDATHIGRFTLAPQTVQVLSKLNKDIEIKAFLPGGESASLKELLTEYKTASSRIRYEFVDPDRQPDVAKQYDVTLYGTVIVSYGDRREKIEKRSEAVQEQDLTNAIIKAGRSKSKKVYFIEGHGEKDSSSEERDGYVLAKNALEAQGYKVGTVNLVSEGKVPEDTSVLIEAGPAKEPFAQELQFVSNFLNSGKGGLLVLVDPQPSPSLQGFFKEWGVQVDNDIVLDVSGFGRLIGAGPNIPLVRNYENHKITERFKTMTLFPMTRSIQPDKTPPLGIMVEPLFKSDEKSWGETNVASMLKTKEASYDEGKDLKGPLPLAMAITKEVKPAPGADSTFKSRMVVAGTSSFPMNLYFDTPGNGNLFLNMISWLAQDEDLISIRPRSQEDRKLPISFSSKGALTLLFCFVVIVLPGIVLVAGIAVYVNRRRK
jgi:ABC-type uncharacterized transport system involved in gliding motility auxiliary subunit